jgi:hypothetical protein
MKKLSALLSLGLLSIAVPARAHTVAFKSPGPGMHFTEGQPLIVFADLFDSHSGYGFIINGVGWPQLQVLVDGVVQIDGATGKDTAPGANMLDGNGNASPVDFNRFSVSGLAAGTHQVVVRGLFAPPPDSDGATVDSEPIVIFVDPVPAGLTMMSLTGNVTGTVNWNNVFVVGNGYTVAPTSISIKNSLVTGLGSLTTPGIDGAVSSVDIEGSIFEATGAVHLKTTGDAIVKNSEFRANNLIAFDASDPDASPAVQFSGTSSQSKTFQGNAIGAGRLVFDGTSNWLIGGDTDDQTNILIGPRCSIYVQNGGTNITIRGNYDHHNYRGGWSQGYNLSFECRECGYASGQGILVEHNFIRDGSWPLQDLVGEFRYNVMYGYGHTWIRSAVSGASIHHNILVPGGDGDLNAGMSFGAGETGLQIYNNTLDGGGMAAGDFAGPSIEADDTSSVNSLRNNLITFSRNQQNGGAGQPRIVGVSGNFLYADYNAFYSPDNDNKTNYNVTGVAAGAHDVSGTGTGALGILDGQLAGTPFAGDRVYPIDDKTVVDEAAVWQRTQKLSTILATFRARYTPKAGSPIVNAGDPADNDSQGRRADIGAVDLDGHDQDQIGKFGNPPSETVPPTVSLTAPADNATVTGTISLSADAQDNPGGSGVALVQFLVDGNIVGQSASKPYSIAFDTTIVSNADHQVAAKAWDLAGNFATSQAITIHVVGNVPRTGGASDGGSDASGMGPPASGDGGGGNPSSSGAGGDSGAGGKPTGGGNATGGSATGGCACALQGSSDADPELPMVVAALLCAIALRGSRLRSTYSVAASDASEASGAPPASG